MGADQRNTGTMDLAVVIDGKLFMSGTAQQRYSAKSCHTIQDTIQACADARHLDANLGAAVGEFSYRISKVGGKRI